MPSMETKILPCSENFKDIYAHVHSKTRAHHVSVFDNDPTYKCIQAQVFHTVFEVVLNLGKFENLNIGKMHS